MRRPTNPEEVTKDVSNPATFGPPIVAPGMNDIRAAAYARQIAERRGPPKYTVPVGGAATPPMPRLDQPPAAEGLTMAESATVQRAAMSSTGAPYPTGGLFQEGGAPAPPRPAAPPPHVPGLSRPPGILPADILPPEALDDPGYKEGHGARYAYSQPELAYKYGVLRGGQKIPPQQLQSTMQKPGLRPETMQQIAAVAEANKAGHPLIASPEEREAATAAREAENSSSGAAGRLGGDTAETGPKIGEKELRERLEKMDDFDFAAFRERMMKDIINNEEQRDIIEKRCAPLQIDDLLMKGYCTQRVPVVPGKFEPTFQSMSGEDDLAIKRLIMVESKTLEVGDRYLLDKYAIMGLTLGLRAVNANPVPSHQDANGDFDEEAFWKKFAYVSRLPFHMLASLGVNYFWFDVRVRTLFVASKLGNG